MRGDASDNLAGVHGIGPKTAAKLLAALGSARAAFDDIAAGGGEVVAAIGPGAAAGWPIPRPAAAWELNCEVMAMHDDVPLGCRSRRGAAAACRSTPAAIRAAFAPHQPGWTIVDALRVLGGADGGAVAAAATEPERTTREVEHGETSWSRPRIKLPPLPKKMDQLSLFD